MKPKRMKTESVEMFKVRCAVETLIAHGMKHYKNPQHSNDQYARALGIALARRFTPLSILIMASEALEDQNAHSLSAQVRASIPNYLL